MSTDDDTTPTEPADGDAMPALIDDLRTAIATADGLDDEERTELESLVRRIELEADEDEDDDPNILTHLDDALSRFQTEHVGLVRVINRIAGALSAGGI